jgi:hypothetical protein
VTAPDFELEAVIHLNRQIVVAVEVVLIVVEPSAVPHLHHKFSQSPLKIVVHNTGSPYGSDSLVEESSTSLEVDRLCKE